MSTGVRDRLVSVRTGALERYEAYVPVLPVVALVGTFVFYPIVQAVYTGFFDKSLTNLAESTFVGLENYRQIVSDPGIQQVLWNTFVWVALGSLLSVAIGFFVGWVLARKMPYPSVVAGFVLIPWILPRVVGASVWKFMFSGTSGIINELLVTLGFVDSYVVMLGDPNLSLYPPIVAMVWRLFPLFALLTMTSMQSIDPHLYEAARMDGATPLEQFRYVTLPMMKYPLAIGFLLLLIYDIRNFSMIWVMTTGGPQLSSTTLPIMVYQAAFQNFNLGMASALSTVLFAVLLVFSYFYIRAYEGVQEDDL